MDKVPGPEWAPMAAPIILIKKDSDPNSSLLVP